MNLHDDAGYEKHREAVDRAVLELGVRENGFESVEVGQVLYKLRIGDAKNGDRLEIGYSSTGAIARSAIRSLMKRGMILQTGVVHEIFGRKVPGRRWWYVATPVGARELERMREAIEARDRSEAWQS